ncbi:DUF4365 domain-containing protein [Enterobacter sp. EC_50]|uniref:DUF4365 domain-containing protein n=1 Tax=Enterobacter TaxID=547 RepID=UPI001C709727|nr:MULTISPECIES: DUF4365 domain-containing protein [Enterobacter]MBW9385415.1 DUF4365 domain-containing protein [Enterobacter sp. EC_62]MBW9442490.1 DUF4365 domain-containing protein [Enterobacter sp. EC_50]MCK7050533.1 DUF4365 domain-containing protein [Enterobacter roggenkampii]
MANNFREVIGLILSLTKVEPRIMYISHKKEQFQVGYLKALVSCAGFDTGRWDVDNDCIDVTLKGVDYPRPGRRNPCIDIQLKATQRFEEQGDFYLYDLNLRNYDHLRDEYVSSPQYLMVLHLPESVSDWIDETGNGITLNNKCYWLSLRGFPASSNTSTVRVKIPKAQKVTVSLLKNLMKQASVMGLEA